jgi:small neutral amino acid transporter SnatA (MarC family)
MGISVFCVLTVMLFVETLLLRQRGLIAMERLTGMLLVAVAVQMLLSGVADYMRR